MYLIPTPLPGVVALALVCLIAYWIGRRSGSSSVVAMSGLRDLQRAQIVANELQALIRKTQDGSGTYQRAISSFQARIEEIAESSESAIEALSDEAERLLKPTLALSSQLSNVYEELRQQIHVLMSFAEIRRDPLTGLRNRRSLEETLDKQLALRNRYGSNFTVAIFDVDHFKQINDKHGHLFGDDVLRRVASTLDNTVRETDLVVRYGGEEFVVVMPETDLDGGFVFADRVRLQIQCEVGVTVSGGVAAAQVGEHRMELLERADRALYAAKDSGRNLVFRETTSEEGLRSNPSSNSVGQDSAGQTGRSPREKSAGLRAVGVERE